MVTREKRSLLCFSPETNGLKYLDDVLAARIIF